MLVGHHQELMGYPVEVRQQPTEPIIKYLKEFQKTLQTKTEPVITVDKKFPSPLNTIKARLNLTTYLKYGGSVSPAKLKPK